MKKGTGFVISMLFCGLLTGCSLSGERLPADRRELAFTVVSEEKLPPELAEIIQEHKKEEIRMTYQDGENMYLIRGYGEQQCGGYSISVADCSQTADTIFLDTQLIGPRDMGKVSKEPSYPYLVVMIENQEKDTVIL